MFFREERGELTLVLVPCSSMPVHKGLLLPPVRKVGSYKFNYAVETNRFKTCPLHGYPKLSYF